MNEHDGIGKPAEAGAGMVSRRALLQQSGWSLVGALLVAAGVGSATAASAEGLWPMDSAALEMEEWLAVCARLDREYALAGEAAFQRDLAAVEARYQQRLAGGPQEAGEAAAVRAACEQERAWHQ